MYTSAHRRIHIQRNNASVIVNDAKWLMDNVTRDIVYERHEQNATLGNAHYQQTLCTVTVTYFYAWSYAFDPEHLLRLPTALAYAYTPKLWLPRCSARIPSSSQVTRCAQQHGMCKGEKGDAVKGCGQGAG